LRYSMYGIQLNAPTNQTLRKAILSASKTKGPLGKQTITQIMTGKH